MHQTILALREEGSRGMRDSRSTFKGFTCKNEFVKCLISFMANLSCLTFSNTFSILLLILEELRLVDQTKVSTWKRIAMRQIHAEIGCGIYWRSLTSWRGPSSTSWCWFHQCFYAQLLRAQIPKVQKLFYLTVFFSLLGSARVKAGLEMLMKLSLAVKQRQWKDKNKEINIKK